MKSKGISLIVLIITIIVIIILSGAVILNLSKNNPIESAKKAKFQSDIDTFKSELSMYVLGKSSNTEGNYDPKLLNADKSGSTENGSQTSDTTRPITEIILSMKGTKYDEKLKVEAGQLVYIGSNITESNWADGLIEVKGFNINVTVKPRATKIGGKVKVSGVLVDITKLESCKIYLSQESGKRPNTPAVIVSKENLKEDMTFDITDGVEPDKTYYIIIDIKMSNENNVRTKEIKVISSSDVSNANVPVLTTGLTAKKWNGDSWETVTEPTNDTSWYNYSSKKWANAQTADGSMWVWIPRYEYKIPTLHSSTVQTIEINFISEELTTATNGYIIHPAFSFGSTQLEGIWVAKFEASGTTSEIDIKPGVTSLRNISINEMFKACRNMETNSKYGWGTSGSGIDTHLMKNSEWGAVAYLSSSSYGKIGEIWINPNSRYLTGQAGTSVNASSTTITYPYDNATYGVNASTTGNVYGVYDMSGGAWEYTAAYVNNGKSSLTSYGLSLVESAGQYKDVYTSNEDTQEGNYSNSSEKVGDTVYETSTSCRGITSWYSDYSDMPYSTTPFFLRGGTFESGSSAGIFGFSGIYGNMNSYFSFRPVLVSSLI